MEDKKNLFLDDYRHPYEVGNYIYPVDLRVLFRKEKWEIVRNYTEFCKWIKENGVPDLVSFDHDLADGHYHKNMQEGVLNYESDDFDNDNDKTGMHCAQFLVNYCMENKIKLPEYLVHSMNPIGAENIKSYLESYKRNTNDK